MVASVTTKGLKDAGGSTFNQNVLDVSGAGTGPFNPLVQLADSTGANLVTVKPPSTPATAADSALVVALSPLGMNANGQATSANSAPMVPASDWFPNPNKVVTTSLGATSSRILATASTNATSLKTSAGNVWALDVYNVAAYSVFLKFYNKASAPTVGTDTPVWTIPLAAGQGYSNQFFPAKFFSTGIAYAITKLQADSDTTVVAAGDVTGQIDWV